MRGDTKTINQIKSITIFVDIFILFFSIDIDITAQIVTRREVKVKWECETFRDPRCARRHPRHSTIYMYKYAEGYADSRGYNMITKTLSIKIMATNFDTKTDNGYMFLFSTAAIKQSENRSEFRNSKMSTNLRATKVLLFLNNMERKYGTLSSSSPSPPQDLPP